MLGILWNNLSLFLMLRDTKLWAWLWLLAQHVSFIVRTDHLIRPYKLWWRESKRHSRYQTYLYKRMMVLYNINYLKTNLDLPSPPPPPWSRRATTAAATATSPTPTSRPRTRVVNKCNRYDLKVSGSVYKWRHDILDTFWHSRMIWPRPGF